MKSRRNFFRVTGELATTLLASSVVLPPAPAKQDKIGQRLLRESNRPKGRILIKGATILSMDSTVGDLLAGDVLIEGKKIVKISPRIESQAEVLDAHGMIVIPGFVDVHRHCWEGCLRRLLPDADLVEYRKARELLAVHYTPEDMYVGNLISALGAIDSGVTCLLDWSHNSRSSAHSDSAIHGLAESGIRAVYGFAAPLSEPWDHQHPKDIDRLRKAYFSSTDQLLSLAMATFIDHPENFKIAKDRQIRVTVDGFASREQGAELQKFAKENLVGPHVTYNHCTDIGPDAFKLIADTGGAVGIAPISDCQIGVATAVPAVQRALDAGIRPAIGTDVELCLPTDFFSQMRTALYFQRSESLGRKYRNDPNAPAPITMRDVLEFTTVEGAMANGVFDKCGSLTPGKEADLVLIRSQDINTMPLNNAVGTVVSGATTANVDTVFIAGRIKKLNGKLTDVNMDSIRKLVDKSRDDLLNRSGWPAKIV